MQFARAWINVGGITMEENAITEMFRVRGAVDKMQKRRQIKS